MMLSTPQSAGVFGGTPAVGRCHASPQEQDVMFARFCLRVRSKTESLSPAQHPKAAGTEKPSPSQPIPEFCHPSRFHAPPGDQEEMMARLRARVGGSEASEAEWTEMRSRYERRERAWDAHVKSRKTPNRRATRPAPSPSNQYCPSLSTTPARDQRLSPGTIRTLVLIRAVIGRDSSRIITRKYLAHTLGYSERTAQRHLSLLRQYGYITSRLVNAPNGRTLGQRIRVTSAARPFWQTEGSGLSPLQPFPINGVSEDRKRAPQGGGTSPDFAEEFASKGMSASPERRPPSG